MTFLSVFAHDRNRCFVTSQNVRFNACGRKSNIQLTCIPSYRRVCSVMFKLPERFRIMTDSQTIDVVTIDFKGTGVRCVVCGSNDYPMNFIC